jgi:cytoskeletal protein RodZ
MTTLGRTLQEARLRQGLSVEDLARTTRIREHYLLALERDDVAALPGVFFYRSYARQYAQVLGLDLALVNDQLPPAHPNDDFLPTLAAAYQPQREPSIRRRRGLLWPFALLCLSIYAFTTFYAWWTPGEGQQIALPQEAVPSAQPASAPPTEQPEQPVSWVVLP